MARVNFMNVTLRSRQQRRRFEDLAEREMCPTIYADDHAMTALGIRESVMYLLHQIGWDTAPIRRRYCTYKKLTLEFLSTLSFIPNHGIGFNRGLITFRMFDMDYTYNLREFSHLLGFPFGPDVITMTQEDLLLDSDLDFFWGSIAGNNHPEPSDLYSECIHNPAIRYFHKIIAHTLFGKEQNVTSVSRDELFIMYCASQIRPVNGAAYMLANMERIIQTPNAPILLGGLVTMISNAIRL